MINSYKKQTRKFKFLAKSISDYYGGDDQEFFDEYCKEQIEKHVNNLDALVDCFSKMAMDLGLALEPPPESKEHLAYINVCLKCGYLPLFCSCKVLHGTIKDDIYATREAI